MTLMKSYVKTSDIKNKGRKLNVYTTCFWFQASKNEIIWLVVPIIMNSTFPWDPRISAGVFPDHVVTCSGKTPGPGGKTYKY